MGLTFQGIHADILALCEQLDSTKQEYTPEFDVEGSLNCGKTTMSIHRQLEKLKRFPGMWAFHFRYSDTDNKTKLRPAIELICEIRGETPKWDATEMFYNFPNGSRLYSFGIKSVDVLSRYSKLRGLGVSDIAVDQAEELPRDLAAELRGRLRPDLRMTLMAKEYPRMLFLTPNPAGHRHWLTQDYPENNSIKGRHYFSLSVYDNIHHIGQQAVRSLESSFPVTHVKHATMVMGKRGMNVIGDAIFEDSFNRVVHVKPVKYVPDEPLFEVFDVGKHCPCWLVAQRGPSGGWRYLGGIIGQDLFLEDFLPIVKEKRLEWFGELTRENMKTAYAKGGGASEEIGAARFTDVNLLRSAGFNVTVREHGSSPDVMLAMIELLAGYMRRRDLRGQECIQVNDDELMWWRASKEGSEHCPFMAQGFEAGIVWDEHMVSVSNREVRRLKEDDWFDHGCRCAATLELNFGANIETEVARNARIAASRERQVESTRNDGPNAWLGW